MKIAIGSDHGGFALKKFLISRLRQQGHEVTDYGTFSGDRCDYPPIGYKVARSVSAGEHDRGVLICKSGLGMSMVANKVPGIRGALLTDHKGARSSRAHNDANVAVFSGQAMTRCRALRLLSVWMKTPFSGGRHARRVRQIGAIERKVCRGGKR